METKAWPALCLIDAQEFDLFDRPRRREADGHQLASRPPMKLTSPLQPFTDDVSALLAISWPFLREAVASHVVAFDAKRVPDNLGGAVAVVAV